LDIPKLKSLLAKYQRIRVGEITSTEIDSLKHYEKYEEVADVFNKIQTRDMVDRPLYLEWNTWRAFNMLDDGTIKGNFVVDDEGMPLYTAGGNKADIECSYRNFEINVEVTMSSGNRQYEQEGESVARHLGLRSQKTNKDTYCIFIAPSISEATLAHYYTLHNTHIAYYGGKAKIIPLELDDFKLILQKASAAEQKPTSENIKNFLINSSRWATVSSNETEWFSKVKEEALACF
jgi:hypothetical protein